MNTIRSRTKGIVIALVVVGLSVACNSWADEKSSSQSSQVSTAVQEDVKSKSEDEIAKKRKALAKEALTTLSETKKALKALEDQKPQEALQALAKVTGQLEIIVSRDPDLAFVPVDVEVATYDLYADRENILEAIEEAKEEVERYLEDGEVQKARALLSNLASEVVISTISLPLATFPDAVKAVVPLIDVGKIEEAKSALRAALNTLVVTNKKVLPLPIIRADALIKKAEELAETLETPAIKTGTESGTATNQGKSGKKMSPKEKVLDYLQQARQQLKIAKVLGYGLDNKNRYEELREAIKAIEEKIEGDESSTGVFDRLKKSLSKAKKYLFED